MRTRAEAIFRAFYPGITINQLVTDGDLVPIGTNMMRLSGNARVMLTPLHVERATCYAWNAKCGGLEVSTRRRREEFRGPEARLRQQLLSARGTGDRRDGLR
jgi:nicotinate-nucleotide pyrophosphorylase